MKTPKRIPERHGKPYARATANEIATVYTPPVVETPAPPPAVTVADAPPRPTFDKGDAWPKHDKDSAQFDPTDDR